jgi:hypothetical protein
MRTIIVRLVSALLGLVIAIFEAFRVHSVTYGVLIGLGSCLLILQIEILLTGPGRLAERDRVATFYRSLSKNKCLVIKELTEAKYTEIRIFFESLSNGHMLLHDEVDVKIVLNLLYCEPRVKWIHATSFGELEELRDPYSWSAQSYAKTQEMAIRQKKHIERIFILRREEVGNADDVLRANANAQITVKTAAQQLISPHDFYQANDCLIFLNRRKEPIYCVQATHDESGHFTGATLYFRLENIQPVFDAYLRILAIAEAYA